MENLIRLSDNEIRKLSLTARWNPEYPETLIYFAQSWKENKLRRFNLDFISFSVFLFPGVKFQIEIIPSLMCPLSVSEDVYLVWRLESCATD